jgi:hypothetical protein
MPHDMAWVGGTPLAPSGPIDSRLSFQERARRFCDAGNAVIKTIGFWALRHSQY